MAVKEKVSPKNNRKSKIETETFETIQSTRKWYKPFKPSRKIFFILFFLGLLSLAIYKKGWFVAATVNNSPITNFELLARLNSQFREQILTQMINEKIIMEEARKKGIRVSGQAVDDRIKELEGNVGGAQTLDDLLKQQNQDRNDLKDQLKLQLIIQRLYENEATVSAEEVKSYIEQNKDQMQATESAKQEIEARDALKQQKLGDIFREKFQQLRESAKINTF